MPVVVMEDGHSWGLEEGLPKFVVVKIPGVTADKARSFIDVQLTDDAGLPSFGIDGKRAAFRRREWDVNWTTLPTGIKNTLLTTGEVTVTVAQIRAFLRRVRDDAQFTGLD
jgi:hypothetical protein